MSGYVKGTNNITSISIDRLDKTIASGAQAYTGAMDEFISNSGFSSDKMSSFVNNSGNFVSYIGDIKRDGYTVDPTLFTKSVSEYSSKGLQNISGLTSDNVNTYIQGMSQIVSSKIDDIRIDGQRLSSAAATAALSAGSQ